MKAIERFAKFRAIPQETAREISTPAASFDDFFSGRPEPKMDIADPIAREPRAYPTSPERIERAAKPHIVVEQDDVEPAQQPLGWLEAKTPAGSHEAAEVPMPACHIEVQEPLPESAYTAMREASVALLRSKLSPSQRAAKRHVLA